MKVALIAPPSGGFLTSPPLSLPSLTAHLRRSGHEVYQCDAGAMSLNAMLAPSYLRQIYPRIASALENPRLSRPAESRRRNELLFEASIRAEHILANIETATSTCRSQRAFFDREAYVRAKNVIEGALKLIAAAYWPFILGHNHVYFGSPMTVEHLLQVAATEDVNPFIAPLQRLLIPELIAENPRVIGISATFDGQLYGAATLSRLIKTFIPAAHVVLGGAAVTAAEAVLRADPNTFALADSFVFGEGESALGCLLEILESKSGKRNQRNNLYMSMDREAGHIQKLSFYNGAEREDFNALPTPDYSGLNFHDYLTPEPLFLLSTSRGCYHGRCAFCNVSLAFRSGFQQRRKELLHQDLLTLHEKYNARWLFIADDCIPPSRCLEIAATVSQFARPLYWTGEVRFEPQFSGKVLRQLYAGGCRQLCFGNESASQRVLDLMDKGTCTDTARRIIRAATRAGIAVHLQNFLGFPGETKEEARQTTDFLASNRHHITSFALGTFHLCEYSPTHRSPEAFGITGLRRMRRNWLVPRYVFNVTHGQSSAAARKHTHEAIIRLERAYSRIGCFLDGPYALHALMYMTTMSCIKLEDLFPSPPVPRNLFCYRPRLAKDVTLYSDSTLDRCVLLNQVSGSACRLRWPAPWLVSADGERSVEELIILLSKRGRWRTSDVFAERAARLVARYIDLYQAGFLSLC